MLNPNRSPWLPLIAALLVAGPGRADVVNVPSTSNIYGAGHTGDAQTPSPGGPTGVAGAGGTAPTSLDVTGLGVLEFGATGTVDLNNNVGASGPDGVASGGFTIGSYNGIAGFSANYADALYGVFTNGTDPADPAPTMLDFTNATAFATLSPALNQIFFIGDGLTGTGAGNQQNFVLPNGATTLFLGVADGIEQGASSAYVVGGYSDNTGAFQVTVTPVPEPGAGWLAVAAGVLVVGAYRRRGTRVAA